MDRFDPIGTLGSFLELAWIVRQFEHFVAHMVVMRKASSIGLDEAVVYHDLTIVSDCFPVGNDRDIHCLVHSFADRIGLRISRGRSRRFDTMVAQQPLKWMADEFAALVMNAAFFLKLQCNMFGSFVFNSYKLHGDLVNAEYIDQQGLFIGNHHYPIPEAVEVLKGLQL